VEIERPRSSTKKGAFTILDDDESDTEGGRNKGKLDKRKKANDKERKLAKVASLRDKIDDMMKSKEVLVEKTMQTKMIITNKKLEEKNTRWKVLREDEACRAAFEERRVIVKEKRDMTELIAKEYRIMLGFGANNKKLLATQPRIAQGPIY
jgi:hypothetical protein